MTDRRGAVGARRAIALLAALATLSGCASADLSAPTGAATQNPPSNAPPVAGVDQSSQVTIIGDSFTSGTHYGGLGPKNWTTLLQHSLAGAGYNTYMRRSARGASGYRHLGFARTTYLMEAGEEVNPDTKMVVFFGSESDAGSIAGLYGAVMDAINLARERSPGAYILVVGPGWCRPAPPSQDMLSTRNAVRDAAVTAGVTFVDPIADNWFDQNPKFIAPDQVHPTDAGHALIADRLLDPFITGLRLANAPAVP